MVCQLFHEHSLQADSIPGTAPVKRNLLEFPCHRLPLAAGNLNYETEIVLITVGKKSVEVELFAADGQRGTAWERKSEDRQGRRSIASSRYRARKSPTVPCRGVEVL